MAWRTSSFPCCTKVKCSSPIFTTECQGATADASLFTELAGHWMAARPQHVQHIKESWRPWTQRSSFFTNSAMLCSILACLLSGLSFGPAQWAEVVLLVQTYASSCVLQQQSKKFQSAVGIPLRGSYHIYMGQAYRPHLHHRDDTFAYMDFILSSTALLAAEGWGQSNNKSKYVRLASTLAGCP